MDYAERKRINEWPARSVSCRDKYTDHLERITLQYKNNNNYNVAGFSVDEISLNKYYTE